MIDPNDLSKIVYNTLKKMEVHNRSSSEILIKGTFLHRSGLKKLFDYRDRYNPLHGFMLFSSRDLKEIHEKIKINRKLNRLVENAVGISIVDTDINSFIEELDYNIAFMVCVTYCFYSLLSEDFPEELVDSAAIFYRRHFLKSDDSSIEQAFVNDYKRVFIND